MHLNALYDDTHVHRLTFSHNPVHRSLALKQQIPRFHTHELGLHLYHMQGSWGVGGNTHHIGSTTKGQACACDQRSRMSMCMCNSIISFNNLRFQRHLSIARSDVGVGARETGQRFFSRGAEFQGPCIALASPQQKQNHLRLCEYLHDVQYARQYKTLVILECLCCCRGKPPLFLLVVLKCWKVPAVLLHSGDAEELTKVTTGPDQNSKRKLPKQQLPDVQFLQVSIWVGKRVAPHSWSPLLDYHLVVA